MAVSSTTVVLVVASSSSIESCTHAILSDGRYPSTHSAEAAENMKQGMCVDGKYDVKLTVVRAAA